MKNVDNQTSSIVLEVNKNWNGLVTNILQNIIFCVPQKKESHTASE